MRSKLKELKLKKKILLQSTDNMISSKDIDPNVRFLVLLQDADMKLSRISKILGKSPSTLYDWKSKLEDGINFLEHQSKNFSPKIDPPKKGKLS